MYIDNFEDDYNNNNKKIDNKLCNTRKEMQQRYDRLHLF